MKTKTDKNSNRTRKRRLAPLRINPAINISNIPAPTNFTAPETVSKDTVQDIAQDTVQDTYPQDTYPQDTYLYVYGIIDNTKIINDPDLTLDLKGLRDVPITKINFKDLGILFSFYPVLHPLVEEKEARLHAQILNKIADKTTVIPMAFGTVFKEQEILETVLAKSYPAIKKTLGLLQDKMELGIKVVKKELAEEISTAVNQEILEELNKLSVKSVAGDKFSERLLLNSSFLVEKDKFTQFSGKVEELEEKHQNVKFLYSGPWPAYSFVDINIKVG